MRPSFLKVTILNITKTLSLGKVIRLDLNACVINLLKPRSLSDLTVRSEEKQELVSFCSRLRRIVALFNEIDREKWLVPAFPQ